MDVVIRKAEKKDVPAMLALVKELAEFEREPDAVVVTEEEMIDAGFGSEPVWFGWVAVRSDDQKIRGSGSETSEIVGIAVCYERYSTWKGRCLYLEDLVVKTDARRAGIGERLFNECVSFAKERNFRLVTWQVLDWNTDAIRFYERLGAQINGGWLNGRLSIT